MIAKSGDSSDCKKYKYPEKNLNGPQLIGCLLVIKIVAETGND